MRRSLTSFLGAVAVALSLINPTLVQAFGGTFFDQSALPLSGETCGFQLVNSTATDPYGETAEVSLFISGVGRFYSGGSYWDFSSRLTASPITKTELERHCGLTNVTITREVGAIVGSSYAAQDFIGLEFIGTSGSTTYQYKIGLQGQADTIPVNTRTPYTPPNAAPTASAGATATTVTSGTQVTLQGSGTDTDGTIVGYSWTRTGGTGNAGNAFSSSNGQNVPFTDSSVAIGGGSVTHEFALVVTDNDGATSPPSNITITIAAPPNTPPTAVANAIPNPAVSGQTVTLDGSGSSSNDTGQSLVSYAWAQTPSLTVTLSDPSAVSPTFEAPAVTSQQTLTFELVVNDGVENSVADTVRVTVDPPADTTPPSVLSLLRNAPTSINTNADSLTWQITFSEPVVNVDASDFLYSAGPTGASLGVTGSGAVYDVTLSGGNLASYEGSVSLGFGVVNNIQDAAGNALNGVISVNESTYQLDNSSDGVLLATPSDPVTGEFAVTLDFQANGNSPAPRGGQTDLNTVLNALQITNATRTGSSGFGGSQVTFNLTPTAPGTVTVALPAGVAFDDAGNPNLTSNVLSVTASDVTPPVLPALPNIVRPTDAGQTTATVNYSFTAIDDVDGAVAAVTNPASNSVFPVGTTTVNVSATDTAGNTSDGSFTVTVNDEENPTVVVPADITETADTGASSKVVNFSVSATDNVDGVIAATANPLSGTAFPVGTTTVTVTATDAAGNIGTNSFTVTINDATAPVVTVPSNIVQATDAGQDYATVTFAVTATDETDGTLTPGVTTSPTAGLNSGDRFPLGTTTVTVSATDSASNTTTRQFTVKVEDQESPVIRPITNVSFEADPSGSRLVYFSAIVDDNVDTSIQPVFRFDGNIITSPYSFPTDANLITVNATDTTGNPAVEVQFTITITPGVAPDTPQITTADINTNRSLTIGGTAEVDSTVRVTFPDATFQEVTATGGVYSVTSAADMTGGTVSVTSTDARGYTSGAATVDLFPDYDGPTVSITGAPSRLTDLTPFTVTITFSENVTGFVQGDITLTGGTITAFAGTGAVYTAEITPNVAEAVAISIGAAVAQDDFGNDSAASAVISIANATLTETEQMVTRGAIQRGIAQSNTRPSLRRFFVGRNFTNFNASVTQGAGNFDFETSSGRPVWAAGQGQWSTNGDMETSYANVTVGAHFEPTENVLLGLMAQFDNAVSDEGVARMESTGWLVGPYAVARLEDQPLVFSASYLMGQSENTASPLGTYEDTFTSDRTMATVGVSGELELTRLTLIPLLDVAYITDQNEAYVDGGANSVRSLKATVAEATLGLDFVMPINTVNGSLDLIGGIGATASVTDDSAERIETTRGRTELGFRYGMENGGRLTARATYDGLGQDDYEAFGAEVKFEISF